MNDKIDNNKEKGIKRERLNWFLRAITLGDRFSYQDFYDRVKKGFVEFLIVFFGVLVSFSVENQGEDFGDREANIDNLVNLRDEMNDIKIYTQEYIEENKWIRALYQKLYDEWEYKKDSVYVWIDDADGEAYSPLSFYSNYNPFNPPRVVYEAIKLDDSNARAHALKACSIGGGLGKNFYEDNQEMYKTLRSHVDKSLEADENDFEVRRISSALALGDKDFNKSLEHAKKGFAINPNDPRILNQYGKVLVKLDNVDEGLKHLHKVLELDPIPQGKATSCERYDGLTIGYFCKEEYEKCIYDVSDV